MEPTKNRESYMIFGGVAVVFVILLVVFLPMTSVEIKIEQECGDNICDENCFTCPLDCICKQEVCYNDKESCGPVPYAVKGLIQKEYGDGYTITESWLVGGERYFRALAGEKEIIIRNENITEIEEF